MNILIPDSWLREYLDTNASPHDIQRCLSLCGPSIERMHSTGSDSSNPDYIYDIEVTTNRVDCMSVYGIAREAAAILPQFGFTAKIKPLKLAKLSASDKPDLTIKNDPHLCRRLLAIKVSGITIKSSPDWIQNRLNAVGIRPINNLVDITNYVMWETGHPTHVFDFDRLTTKKMLIREAAPGETLVTLDEKPHDLVGGEVVIDDGTGQIIDLPSIMGTQNSVVQDSTTSVLLFVDSVISSKVRFASMKHTIRTQAATLLEKDIDPEIGLIAMKRMLQIVHTLFPKAQISGLEDIFPPLPPPAKITFPVSRVGNLMGASLPMSQIKEILKRLNFQVSSTSTAISVTPPSWRRFDILIPEDVIEEIARIYGYHNIPSELMGGILPTNRDDSGFLFESRIKTAWKYLGHTETYSYSLTTSANGDLALSNPLSSEWTHLRTSLTPSHLQIISENSGRIEHLDLFEIANVYLPKPADLPTEQLRLIVSTTRIDTADSNHSNYFRFKGKIEAFLQDLKIGDFEIRISAHPNCYVWEVAVEDLLKKSTNTKPFTPISRFAPIYEDFNIKLTGSYSQLEKLIYSKSPLIKNVLLIDHYNDKITLRLTFHTDDHQLNSNEILPLREQIMQISQQNL